MSILVINDPHTSDKPPRYRTASYNDDIFDKMDQAVRIGHENSVDFGVITGDLFHNPQAGKNSHLLVNRWMRFFYESELDWYILPGNHDLSAGRLASINKQPIGVLANHPNVTLLEDGVVHNTINDGRIVGIGWNYAMDAEYIKQRVPDDIDVLFIHAAIWEQVQKHWYVIQMSELAGLAQFIVYGHVHRGHEPVIVDNTWFVNAGAISRSTHTKDLDTIDLESDSRRIPKVTIIDGGSATSYSLKARPAHEIFRYEVHEAQEAGSEAIQKFVESLEKAEVGSVTLEDLISELGKLTGESDIVELATQIMYSV